jgi:hypothetical protein
MADCLKWHGEGLSDVVDFCRSLKFLVWQRLPGKAFQFTQTVDEKTYSQDLLLIPEEQANNFAWCCPTWNIRPT